MLMLYKALRFLGDVFLSAQDEETAENLFTVALVGFTYLDVHRARAQCMLRLGDLAKQHGDILKARDLWATAQPLFERSLQAEDLEQINARLTIGQREQLDSLDRLGNIVSPITVPTQGIHPAQGVEEERFSGAREVSPVAI
jgi:hypothetical protein